MENFPSIPHDVPEGSIRHALMEDFLYIPCDVSGSTFACSAQLAP